MSVKSVLMIGMLGLQALAAPKKAPSSEIPERREFPLSVTAAPCENFHDYVCSEAEASFKLREDRSRHIFAFSDSSERLLLKKREFFKNIKKEKNLSSRGQALKNNYLSCMDATAGAREEKSWIAASKKEIYAIKSIEEFRDLQVGNLSKGRPSLLEVGEAENVDNPLVYDFYLSANFMSLPDHSYYTNEALLKDYKKLIIAFFKITSSDLKPTEIEKKAEAILQLEKDFIKIYPTPEVRRQRWVEKRTTPKSDFMKTYPNWGVQDLFRQFPESIQIRLLYPEVAEFYNNLLQTQNLPLLQDYFFFSTASHVMDDGYPELFAKGFQFRHKYFGDPEKRPVRQERCTMRVMGTFAKELDEILLPRLFPNFPEEKFRTVVEKIRASIITGMEANNWLSPETKKEAIQKMRVARMQLIKPQNEREWDFHPNVEYSPKTQIRNAELLAAAEFKKMLSMLPEPVNTDRWGMGPLVVNAYYDPSSNKFVMPLGILQYPFFDANGELLENLGSVGAVVGHELGHGIDDKGSRFDETGKLRQWMSMKDLAEFSRRTSQLVTQFDKIGHNGKLTLGENVADLVGVTFGYNAAFPNGEGSLEDKKRFFVSYARLWCGVALPKMQEKQLKTDPHSLGWARINEPLKHQKGFVEAFQCKPGDKMYLPENERVSIW